MNTNMTASLPAPVLEPMDEPAVPCNDQHDEVHREEIYRFKDSDPPYKESRETYYCRRPLGHQGDHSVKIREKGMIFWWRAKPKPQQSKPFLPFEHPGLGTLDIYNSQSSSSSTPKPKGKGFLARLLTKESDEDSTSGKESSG